MTSGEFDENNLFDMENEGKYLSEKRCLTSDCTQILILYSIIYNPLHSCQVSRIIRSSTYKIFIESLLLIIQIKSGESQ
jgi:hypothetical protein